jgi:hypothetical protein
MARILDLNEVQSSFLDLTLRDKDRTVVHLDIPSEETVNRLQNMQGDLDRMKTGDQAAVRSIYELMACLINCNLDYITVTAEELPAKYGMNLVVALKFFSVYMESIEELANSKN